MSFLMALMAHGTPERVRQRALWKARLRGHFIMGVSDLSGVPCLLTQMRVLYVKHGCFRI